MSQGGKDPRERPFSHTFFRSQRSRTFNLGAITTAGNPHTIYTPPGGRRFCIYWISIFSTVQQLSPPLTIQSDATPIGYLFIGGNASWFTNHMEVPVLQGLRMDEALKISLGADATITGQFLVTDLVGDLSVTS